MPVHGRAKRRETHDVGPRLPLSRLHCFFLFNFRIYFFHYLFFQNGGKLMTWVLDSDSTLAELSLTYADACESEYADVC